LIWRCTPAIAKGLHQHSAVCSSTSVQFVAERRARQRVLARQGYTDTGWPSKGVELLAGAGYRGRLDRGRGRREAAMPAVAAPADHHLGVRPGHGVRVNTAAQKAVHDRTNQPREGRSRD
jgi:hypothetical protein